MSKFHNLLPGSPFILAQIGCISTTFLSSHQIRGDKPCSVFRTTTMLPRRFARPSARCPPCCASASTARGSRSTGGRPAGPARWWPTPTPARTRYKNIFTSPQIFFLQTFPPAGHAERDPGAADGEAPRHPHQRQLPRARHLHRGDPRRLDHGAGR